MFELDSLFFFSQQNLTENFVIFAQYRHFLLIKNSTFLSFRLFPVYVHRRRWQKKEISIQFLIIFFFRFTLKSQFFFVWIFIYFKIIFIFIFSEFLSKYFFSKFKINKLEILKKNFPKKTQLNRFDTLYNSFKISFQNLFFCRGKRVILFDDYDKDCACSVCCVCVCVWRDLFFSKKSKSE